MKKIHFVGIGGISLSALALICQNNGFIVSGSDTTESEITQNLIEKGIKVVIGHNADNVFGADLVVYSSAIKCDNIELLTALKLGIPTQSRAQLLGDIANRYKKIISISGSHGKTTTTGMIASIFIEANKNPTVHIGGILPKIGGNVCVGNNDFFITEACEYCDSFLSLNSFYSIVLNIQKDHIDYFKNMSNLQKSFEKFAKNTNNSGFLIINNDDKLCRKLKSNSQVLTYGILAPAIVMAQNIKQKSGAKFNFDLCICNKKIATIHLSASGYHNIYNALASICVALLEDIDISIIKSAISDYQLPERRFEIVSSRRAKIIHDYAHHPTEIISSIKTARAMCKKKLIVAFQPHTYSRTQYLFKEFSLCFENSDKLLLCPIYPAREKPIFRITSEKLAEQIAKNKIDVEVVESLKDCSQKLREYDKKGNYILLLGAGSIVDICKDFR